MKRLLKLINSFGPNRADREWACTIKQTPGYLMLMGRPFQIIGGRTWTLSFIRTGTHVRGTDFWDC